MAGAAILSDYATRNPGGFKSTPVAIVASPAVALLLKLMAAGEMVADKLPAIPDRIAPGPLFGRMGAGAAVGAAIFAEERKPLLAGAAIGAGAALAGAFAGYAVRRALTSKLHLPDFVVALAEDAFTITAGTWLARR